MRLVVRNGGENKQNYIHYIDARICDDGAMQSAKQHSKNENHQNAPLGFHFSTMNSQEMRILLVRSL